MKQTEIDILVAKLMDRGMDKRTAVKNLLECDRYFIEKLNQIL